MKNVRKHINIHTTAAVMLFLVTCVSLYIIEHVIYGGAVSTVFIYATIYPPLVVLLYLAFGRKRFQKDETTQDRREMQTIAAYVILAGCTIFMFSSVFTATYVRLGSLQILAAMTALSAVAAFQKLLHKKTDVNFKADAVSIVFSAVLLATILFLLIVRPYTVNGARKALELHGYQDAFFDSHHPPDSAGDKDAASRFGSYSFLCGPNRESVHVDVATGEVAAISTP